MTTTVPFLDAQGVRTWFPVRGTLRPRGLVKAVDDVSLTIARGEVLGLVGESGSGKSTLGRSLMRLVQPTAGRVLVEDTDVLRLPRHRMRRWRRRMQIVFQDPDASLNPRMTVHDVIAEPLDVHRLCGRAERTDRVLALMERVGLRPEQARRYPHAFSGGQRQRIGIARALAVAPDFIFADEPVSALDVSVQAQVINLMVDLQRDLNLTMLFVSHDLSVVEYISDRVAVMYLGRLVEVAPAAELYRSPRHPYTQALLSAAPLPIPREHQTSASRRVRLVGEMPSPMAPPSGCVFRTRCPVARPDCADAIPAMRTIGADHYVACHLA